MVMKKNAFLKSYHSLILKAAQIVRLPDFRIGPNTQPILQKRLWKDVKNKFFFALPYIPNHRLNLPLAYTFCMLKSSFS